MRTLLAALTAIVFAACGTLPEPADPDSDAPEQRLSSATRLHAEPAAYEDALRQWHGADDINAWIGAKFEYDTARAMRLSETQRERNGRLPIIPPAAFFAAPRGVCIDLSRFAVETLRALDPLAQPMYLMIEFDPVAVAGNTLRRHWVVSFEREGQRYFFADSRRPGHVAGPYRSSAHFIADYASYRGRRIVSFSEVDSYERKARTLAERQSRESHP